MNDCGCFVPVNSRRFRRRNIVEFSVLRGIDRTEEPKQEGAGRTYIATSELGAVFEYLRRS